MSPAVAKSDALSAYIDALDAAIAGKPAAGLLSLLGPLPSLIDLIDRAEASYEDRAALRLLTHAIDSAIVAMQAPNSDRANWLLGSSIREIAERAPRLHEWISTQWRAAHDEECLPICRQCGGPVEHGECDDDATDALCSRACADDEAHDDALSAAVAGEAYP